MKKILIFLFLIITQAAFALEKNALIVITNHGEKGTTGDKTGWFLSEVTHIYYPLINAGYKVTFASPKGGLAPIDPSSIKLEDIENKKFFNEKTLLKQTENTIALAKVDPKKYSIIHFAGGHGAMWDFPNSEDLQKVTANIYENSGIVSTICHGPAALINVKLSNGDYLVKNKDLSAFTDKEEETIKLTKVVPFLLESTLRSRGAIMHPADNWADQSSTSERLVTGQNPMSGHSVAKRILELVSKNN